MGHGPKQFVNPSPNAITLTSAGSDVAEALLQVPSQDVLAPGAVGPLGAVEGPDPLLLAHPAGPGALAPVPPLCPRAVPLRAVWPRARHLASVWKYTHIGTRMKHSAVI